MEGHRDVLGPKEVTTQRQVPEDKEAPVSVVEDVMVLGSDHPLRSIVRDEHLLLSPPHPPKVPVKLWGSTRH